MFTHCTIPTQQNQFSEFPQNNFQPVTQENANRQNIDIDTSYNI